MRSVKALIIVFLCFSILGTAAYFGYELFIKPQKLAREEMAQETPVAPDPSLPDFEKCLVLKKEGKVLEARSALETFIDNYPISTKLENAKEVLGEINTDIFLSAFPTPEKEEYIVKSGDVLVKIATRMKTTAELIMRSNNLEGTMLHIGDKLLISHPEFSLIVNRKEKKVTLFNKGKFFKQYKTNTWNVPASKSNAPITGKVTEKIAWNNGQRVAFGTKEYAGSSRWIILGVPGYTLYSEPTDPSATNVDKPPSGIGLPAESMEELSTLVYKNVPVTIE